MTCGHVDALWRTAEALVHSGDEAHALDAYRYILANCTNPQDRLATVQKANALITSPDALAGLMRMEKHGAGGRGEFEQVRLDSVRQTIGTAASGGAGPAPTPAELDLLAAAARNDGGGGDAELLGWYALSKKDFAQAETWFRAALDKGLSPKAAEGLVLALRDGGKMPEASLLAQKYAALGPLNQKLMMEVMVASLGDATGVPLTPAQQSLLSAAIDAQKSADAAQSYGWSRFKADDIAGAEIWFRKSAGWQPSEPAAIGLMLVAKRLKHPQDYAATVAQYRATYPRVAELDAVMRTPARPTAHAARTASRHAATQVATRGDGWDKSPRHRHRRDLENGKVDEALAMMDQRKSEHPEPKGLTVVRGWALFKKGDWDQAQRVFTDLDKQGMTVEAAEGLRQIQLGYTNPRYR